MVLQNKQNPLILVVDDEAVNRTLLKSILNKANYDVAIATNGTDALKYIDKNIPDMILLDIIMQDMDGFDVCIKLKESSRTSHIPIIFITARTDAEFITKGFQCGAKDYIKKPYLKEEVLARVKTIFQNIQIATKLKDLNKDLEKQVDRRTEDLTAVMKILQIGYRYTTVNDILNKIVMIIYSTIRVGKITLVEIDFDGNPYFFGENLEGSISFSKKFSINSGKSGLLKIEFKPEYQIEEREIKNILLILINKTVNIIEFIEEEEEAKKSSEITKAILACSSDGILVVDSNQKIVIANPAFSQIFGYENSELIGENLTEKIAPESTVEDEQDIFSLINEEGETLHIGKRLLKNGETRIFSITGSHLTIQEKKYGYLLFYRDISEKLKMESELVQENKIRAIGRLASGIAHEINSPSQYIKNNLEFLKDSFFEIVSLIKTIDKFSNKKDISESAMIEEILKNINEANLDYFKEEIGLALDESIDGVTRITEIVNAMRTFSHPGGLENEEVDIQEVIEKVIIVSRNEWKYDADIETEFEHGLLVPAHKDKISQILINLIINAVHAIHEKGSSEKGLIKIKTFSQENKFAEIHVVDNGAGIPDHVKERILEPFFTTKEIGKGTGQGLAMVYNLVTKNYKGQLSFNTKLGIGTTFIVRLPLISNNEEKE